MRLTPEQAQALADHVEREGIAYPLARPRLRLSWCLWLVALVAVWLGGVQYGERRAERLRREAELARVNEAITAFRAAAQSQLIAPSGKAATP